MTKSSRMEPSMPKSDPEHEPKKTDAKPAEKKKVVARKDEQRTFSAPGIERQK